MKTKQEQIDEMAVIGCVRNPQAHTAEECAKCDFKQGQCNAYRHAEALYSIGYRKVPDGAVVLTPEERDDEMKATNEILAERDDLIAKVGVLGRENYDLKAENKQLKTECALLDDELRIARQETIDVLNKLKEKIFHCLGIENIQQASGLSLLDSLVTYDIVIDNIDELLEKYEK